MASILTVVQCGSMSPAEGRWRLKDKHFFNQRGAHLTALDYHKATNMLVVAYSSGVFDLYQVSCAQHLPRTVSGLQWSA